MVLRRSRYTRVVAPGFGPKLASGTIHPILARLEGLGWLESRWEDIDPATEGRPSRRFYVLTPDGTVAARREVALMRQQMSRATGPLGHTQEA